MLKFLFLCLLIVNGLLFAYHQGHLEKMFPSGREPGRMSRQLNADKFKLIPAPGVTDSVSASTPSAVASSKLAEPDPGEKPNLSACTEIGNFTAAEAKRFEARLAGGPAAAKLSRRAVQEVSSHMILIPPQENREGAEKKADELRRLGVTDFYVISENTDQRWGISLGIFKTEEAARARFTALNQQGVQSARLIEHKIPLNRVAFQLRDLGGEAQGMIDKVKLEFPRQEVRGCE
jgi:hypothetical protein